MSGYAAADPRARVGISGWRYQPWRGAFYPAGLPQRLELNYAANRLDSIEVNGTFYGLQRPASFVAWQTETPQDFKFSVKGSNFITHRLRLKNAHDAVATFFASGVLALREKLGPFLWQLPPTTRFDADTLGDFLGLLPKTVAEAKKLAAGQTRLAADRVWLEPVTDGPIHHALEVRHESFRREEFIRLLRAYDIAAVIADTAGRWPRINEVTSQRIVYLRLHGDKELYASGYTPQALDKWADEVRGWLTGERCPDGKGRDVYVFFNNDAKVRAPFDAMALRQRLGLRLPDGEHTARR